MSRLAHSSSFAITACVLAALFTLASPAAAGAWKYEIVKNDGHELTYTEDGKVTFYLGCGRFFALQVKYPGEAKKEGKADITIDATSIDTGVAALDTHLKSNEFFNAAEFGTAKFTADKFAFNGDKVSEVVGTLTLLGKTQPVTLKASNFNCYVNPMLKREVCGGDFETTIQRSQFGLGVAQSVAPDDVHLLIQVEAIRQ